MFQVLIEMRSPRLQEARYEDSVSYAEQPHFRWFEAYFRGFITLGKHMLHPIVRFAPSPTGRIHIGNARTALLNWLFVRRHGGTFILRFDDTDLERSRTEYADAIEADLEWLGIRPDLVRRQSERMAAYDEAAARLRDLGRLYPAYETPEELDRRR